MTENIITFSKLSSTSYLLKINTIKILINTGNISYTTDTYDAILITNFEYKYINSLTQFTSHTNVFMTVPTFSLSKIIYKEIFSTKYIKENYNINIKNTYKSEDEIDNMFLTFNQLKYSQPYEISENLVITAYRSGFSLGNSLWKIKKDNEVILVCFDINHKKENHVDGLDIDTFKDVNICILQAYNNHHQHLPEKNIEEQLKCYIMEKERVFIFVSYVRLLELCYIVNDILMELKGKGSVLSNYGSCFLKSVRGMTEWAGERVLKDFSKDKNIPFRFDTLSFVDAIEEISNIVIVVDEGVNNYIVNGIFYKYQECDKTAMLFFENEDCERELQTDLTNFDVDIPEILPLTKEEHDFYKNEQETMKKKIEEDRIIAEYLKTKIEESEDEIYTTDKDIAKNMFWYQYKYDLWITEETEKYAHFPILKPLRHDEYGEKFIFFGENNAKPVDHKENILKEDSIDNSIPKTKVTWHHKNINLKNKKRFFRLHGHSDFESIVNILELTQPKKLIFFGDEKGVDYYYYYFSLNPEFTDVFALKNELNLNMDGMHYKYLTVDEDFYSTVHFKKIKDFFYTSFVGSIENATLTFVEKSRPFLIGSIKVHELKNKFIGEGFKVELNNNILVVEDRVEIVVRNETDIEMKGEYDDVYMSIRNLIYKELAFL